MPFQRPTPGPLPPTLAENLRSVLNRDMALTASSQGEDVLLSEARIVSEEDESWQPPERPFPVGNFDPRTAIFRAREAYRERVRAKAAAERQSAGVEAAMGFPAAAEVVSAAADESTPDPGDRIPYEAGAAAAPWPAQVPEVEAWPSDTTEAGSLVVESTVPVVTESSGGAAPTESPAFAGEPRVGEPVMERQPLPASDEKPTFSVTGTEPVEKADSARRPGQLDESERLPEWYRTELPRICRTCRDYRPSADGQRGWCANTWAFTHRRLVLEDDPAPCQSAIGDWWLPVDDVWLVAADVSAHGRATPLLDRLTANAERQRRRS